MKTVRVVDTIFQIVTKHGVKDDDGNPAHGTTSLDRCEIEIEAGASKERQRWALIHEIAHASFHETGMAHELSTACGSDKADLIEEDIVRRFVPCLLATLRSAKVR